MLSCRDRLAVVVALVAASSWSAADAAPGNTVGLPQDHEYQKVLRQHLGTLTAADFTIDLKPIGFREEWACDDEQLHRLWVLTRSFPDPFGLTLAPGNFLLATIEGPEGVRMRAGKRGSVGGNATGVHPDDTVWWSTWKYPGNPYRDSRAVRQRAFVVAAVDMIMLDKLHESGTHWVNNARRSDFLGGTLAWLAHVYHDVRADLPPHVQQAYETGLGKFVDRLTEWGPTGVCDNMDMKALVAMAYISATFHDGPMVEKAQAYARRVLGLVHPAGIVRDAGGLEPSYNGIALFDVAWAAAVAGQAEVLDAERRMTILKAHLTLPEPDFRTFFGPTHFSTRTSADSANDQWAFPQRDISIAMRCDEAMYLMHGGRLDRGPTWAAPDRQAMVKDIEAEIEKLNKTIKPCDEHLAVWAASWWSSGRFNYAADHYRAGFYDRLRRRPGTDTSLVVPPIVRPGAAFIKAFPEPTDASVKPEDTNAFLIARFPDYATVIYTGPIGWHSYMNFAGGALSAFWTPSGGSIVLGRTGKPTTPDKGRQTWADWRLWPTHAISGQTASGDAFSSARIRREVSKVDYSIQGNSATVTMSGPIGKGHDQSRAAQNGCITGDVKYQRTFVVGPGGVEVETRLESDGTDRVTDLCETIPLFLHDARQQVATPKNPDRGVPHRVEFQIAGKWVAPEDGFMDGVAAVRIERFKGAATIVFQSPCRVRLGEEWADTYMSNVVMRNVLIDVLGKHAGDVPLPTVKVRYRIEPGKGGPAKSPDAERK